MNSLVYGSTVTLEIKSDGDGGTFEGYASTFNKDTQGDTIANGAFASTIKSKKSFPILQFHNPELWSGNTTEIVEDSKGLAIKAQLNLDTSMGRDAWGILKGAKNAGFPVGLSIGFIPGKSRWDEENKTRVIEGLELYEISMTPWPANRQARISGIKSMLDVRLSEQYVRDATKCSGEVAKRVISFLSASLLAADASDQLLTIPRDVANGEGINALRNIAQQMEKQCHYKLTQAQ